MRPQGGRPTRVINLTVQPKGGGELKKKSCSFKMCKLCYM